MLDCKDCFYWLEDRCIWHPYDPTDLAPCEQDDEPNDIDDDCGFDPYAGCYTWDC